MKRYKAEFFCSFNVLNRGPLTFLAVPKSLWTKNLVPKAHFYKSRIITETNYGKITTDFLLLILKSLRPQIWVRPIIKGPLVLKIKCSM